MLKKRKKVEKFLNQWVRGLGCPVVYVGWFANRGDQLTFAAGQGPLQPALS